MIQRLATGGILSRPNPDHPGSPVAGYAGAILKKWASDTKAYIKWECQDA